MLFLEEVVALMFGTHALPVRYHFEDFLADLLAECSRHGGAGDEGICYPGRKAVTPEPCPLVRVCAAAQRVQFCNTK